MAKSLRENTWTCDVCRRTRPDAKIGTFPHTHIAPNGVKLTMHVKYCRDSETCKRRAYTSSLTQIELGRAASELQSLQHALEESKHAWKVMLVLLGVIAVLWAATLLAYPPWQ